MTGSFVHVHGRVSCFCSGLSPYAMRRQHGICRQGERIFPDCKKGKTGMSSRRILHDCGIGFNISVVTRIGHIKGTLLPRLYSMCLSRLLCCCSIFFSNVLAFHRSWFPLSGQGHGYEHCCVVHGHSLKFVGLANIRAAHNSDHVTFFHGRNPCHITPLHSARWKHTKFVCRWHCPAWFSHTRKCRGQRLHCLPFSEQTRDFSREIEK